MKVGQIRLARTPDRASARFTALVEALDRLAVEQHVIVASDAEARRLERCPFVTLGPVVSSPVMANCVMPTIDIAHVHDLRAGQAGLLLTLTRRIPFVLSAAKKTDRRQLPLTQAVLNRAQAILSPDENDADATIAVYRRIVDAWSELPQDANGG